VIGYRIQTCVPAASCGAIKTESSATEAATVPPLTIILIILQVNETRCRTEFLHRSVPDFATADWQITVALAKQRLMFGAQKVKFRRR